VNLLLLQPDDFIGAQRVRLTGRRCRHLREVLGVQPGQQLRVGVIDGPMGQGRVTATTPTAVELQVELAQAPPEPLPLTLVLGLSRPKMMRRIFRTIAELGIKHAVIVNTRRVEKSFWQSPALAADAVRHSLCEGLEQARDTVLPLIEYRRRFKPFAEDELPALTRGRRALAAHPGAAAAAPPADNGDSLLLCIGPEGGFIPYEIELLERAGCSTVDLGPRILRVENAITVAATRLLAPGPPA
jgi:16S rRNA (uracil1498-N3)-methyltransferase